MNPISNSSNLGILLFLVSFILSGSSGCQQNSNISSDPQEGSTISVKEESNTNEEPPIIVGADQFEKYLPIIKDKNVILTVNQTSRVSEGHLVDVLVEKGVNVRKIFAPEHGFRGKADAGAVVKDGKDVKTGIPIVSLYGKKKKPGAEDLKGADYVIFDIQDVGARFYTYISTLHYLMEACAENGIKVLVLDRPNPNGHYVDGPVLKPGFESFVGMHKIPIVHGMTVGEIAGMINGESWLKNGVQCDLDVINCLNYDHEKAYHLPVKPSPNLPNMRSIYLYPSLCLFEGTVVNIGRGTGKQFQLFGDPSYPDKSFSYTPVSRDGAKYPKHQDTKCYGVDLSGKDEEVLFLKTKELDLNYLFDFYAIYPDKKSFFLKNKFFDKLAGTDQLRKDIIAGKSFDEVKKGWAAEVNTFKTEIRSKYLLYKDFE